MNIIKKSNSPYGNIKINKDRISSAEALEILNIKSLEAFFPIMEKASELRRKHFGNSVSACSIVNAKCGNCPEDCAFCAQSVRAKTGIETYPMISESAITENAAAAAENGSSHYGIVSSGRSLNDENDLDIVCSAIKEIKKGGKITLCASLGILNAASLRKLKNAGLERYHHNIEASRSYFSKICSTRNYDDQISAVIEAKKAGLSVCSGGIFGLGESLEQRIELLCEIRSLDVDSVPLNFLNPIKGTPLEKLKELTPFDCLKIIAVSRLMMPEKTIRICGGREKNLRDFQSWMFFAGANALMIGGYLVTAGRPVKDDLHMIKDAGFILRESEYSLICPIR
jgi:biotin synthase